MNYPFDIHPSDLIKSEVTVGWRCPSNIAIVKYWGKYGRQLPRNASLSLTLSEAHTETVIKCTPHDASGVSLSFLFEGKENEAFARKIERFLTSVLDYYPWLKGVFLDIESQNSFPHSSGIASSASAMAAIAMCINDIEAQATGQEINMPKASYLARLGSGSASRSVIPKVGVWGHHEVIANSSDEYAVGTSAIHEVFKTFHDDILIVSDAEKSVSSTAGHQLMENNVYASARYAQANQRVEQLYKIMKEGDVRAFGKLAEDEAMTLHALMMCSDPSYILMEPGTLHMINEIRRYRAETGAPIYFTLDAGPNIHLLYPEKAAAYAESLVHDVLLKYTVNGRVIKDKVGNGPQKLV